MLSLLEISNFRCFENHKVHFESTTFLVGENNAGKSTIIEALRLIGIVQNRYRALTYNEPPDWLYNTVDGLSCVKVSLQNIDYPAGAVFNNYHEPPEYPPAKITANFKNGTRIDVYVGKNYEIYGIPYETRDFPVQSKSEARKSKIPTISVLPQLRQLQFNEVRLKENYVKKLQATDLSSIHFRNEIYYNHDKYFKDFKALSEKTWDGLTITDFEYAEDRLALYIRDGYFVGEVGWMGSGLKMWLQIMWFLTKARNSNIIVLDEPDIYMHPDLQRKLARIARSYASQTILTTHSAELLSEVSPNEVIIVNKNMRESSPATDLKAVQEVLDRMSSVQNLQLFRLWSSRRFLIVEGNDFSFLSNMHEKLFPESQLIFSTVPNMSIGGWDGWERVLGSKGVFKNGLEDDIKIYSIFDRDFRSDEELLERKRKARDLGFELHIWERKEIENYLLSPKTIARVINDRVRRKSDKVTVEAVKDAMKKIADDLKNATLEDLMNGIGKVQNRGVTHGTVHRMAKERLEKAWETFEGKVSIISGKLFINAISEWSMKNYHVKISDYILNGYIEASDLCSEIVSVLGSIDGLKNFH